MLDGLDEIAWERFTHAYGSAGDTPGLLRAAASADREEASEAVAGLHGSIFHQGTVYPATVPAIPFLTGLAESAPHGRDRLVWMLGMLADPRHAYGTSATDVRQAVAAQSLRLTLLLDDPEPTVREAAAYAVRMSGGYSGSALPQRWEVESDSAVRASLALAIGSTPFVRDLVLHGEPPVCVAAALALLRAGHDLDADRIAAVVAAIDDGASVAWYWAPGGEWYEELLTAASPSGARRTLAAMLHSPKAATRSAGIWAMNELCARRRSAPAALLPLVAPLLEDQDEDVRAAAFTAFRRGGWAVHAYRDTVAGIAARYPEVAGSRAFTREYEAIEILMRLGDPRWVRPACEAATHQPRFAPGAVRFTPEVRDAIRSELPGHAAFLAPLITYWGDEAGPLIPALVEALHHGGPQAPPIAAALLHLGHDEPAAVPCWRAMDGLPAAFAVARVTGDDSVAVDALRTALTGTTGVPSLSLPEVDGLERLLPVATPYLTGEAPFLHSERERQLLAARVVAAVAGPDAVLPTIRAVLDAGDAPSRDAADLIADLAADPGGSLRGLMPGLRARLDDPRSRLSAARALARLGVPTADLAETLVRGMTDHDGRHGAAIVVELGAAETVPGLGELLARDDRPDVPSSVDDVVWADEIFQELVREAIARLSRP
ncbi:hypothetical protein [Actinoplanes sp. NPDC023714]|uniref:hypothetical protein n=1 Tax=Actinoplanes sp. NPDC023714 TaxID=3154322 RepID=UPI0033E1257A